MSFCVLHGLLRQYNNIEYNRLEIRSNWNVRISKISNKNKIQIIHELKKHGVCKSVYRILELPSKKPLVIIDLIKNQMYITKEGSQLGYRLEKQYLIIPQDKQSEPTKPSPSPKKVMTSSKLSSSRKDTSSKQLSIRGGKVSILMPNYNNGKFIHKAIQSIINQVYTNWELIIIDDVSTDNSIEIIESLMEQYAKYPIKLVRNRVNMGVYHTLNNGLDYIQGEFITKLDPDDLLIPSRLAMDVYIMNQRRDILSVISKFVRFNDSNKIVTPSIFGESCMTFRTVVFQVLGKYMINRFGSDSEYMTRFIKVFGVSKLFYLNQVTMYALSTNTQSQLTSKYRRESRNLFMRYYATLSRYYRRPMNFNTIIRQFSKLPISREDHVFNCKLYHIMLEY